MPSDDKIQQIYDIWIFYNYTWCGYAWQSLHNSALLFIT